MRNRFLTPGLPFASFIFLSMLIVNVMGESAMQSAKEKKSRNDYCQ